MILKRLNGRSPATVPSEKETEKNPLFVGGFGSYHTGGAQFVMADGSTRFLSQSIAETTLRQLGNRADGELLGSASDGW